MNSGRGWHSQCFRSRPRTGATVVVAKKCPHRPQAFNKVNDGQEITFFLHFFLYEPIAGTILQGISSYKKFQVNSRKIWMRRANLKSYLTPKVDSIPGTNYANYPSMFSAERSKCSRRFFGDRRWNLARKCCMTRYPAVDECFVLFCFVLFRRKFWIS